MNIESKSDFLKNNKCSICKGTGEVVSTRSVEKCVCIKSWEMSYKLYIKCIKSGLNKSDLDYDISTYYGSPLIPRAVQGFIRSFKSKSSTNIFFHGTVNTQKSTIARYMSRELIKRGLKTKYILMDSLIKTLIKSHDHDEAIKEAAVENIESYLQADFLVIDESFDKERITLYKSNYQLPFLTTFLKDRLEVIKKSTVFISNKTPKEISQQGFTEALQSLIIRECLLLEFKDSLDKKHAMTSTDFLDVFC